jgi:hypothetical protein
MSIRDDEVPFENVADDMFGNATFWRWAFRSLENIENLDAPTRKTGKGVTLAESHDMSPPWREGAPFV